MRLFGTIVIFFSILLVIRWDLNEGSLQHASFYNNETCTETFDYSYVVTIVGPDDTIHSLFANTISPVQMTFTERLTLFYKMNKHLQKQPLIAGEQVKIPMKEASLVCEK